MSYIHENICIKTQDIIYKQRLLRPAFSFNFDWCATQLNIVLKNNGGRGGGQNPLRCTCVVYP